jgi:hypothetical protein
MTRISDDAEHALSRAQEWLVTQQGSDGGWHSKTYGQLKEGAAITSLALDALSRAADKWRQDKRQVFDRGLAFLARGLAKRGTIAGPDGTLDFPTYAAALWLDVQRRLRRTDNAELQTIIKYLVAAQLHERRGFQPDSVSYGGWDFLGPDDARGITTGTNVSVTRYVAEALANGRESNDTIEVALRRAKAYVLRCQQPDGGFAFTCEPASLNNKAAFRDKELKQPRSYGTATCDGIRALLSCRVKPTDEPAAKAFAWLARRPGLEIVRGFEELPPEAGWQRGLRFYYYAALAPILSHFPDAAVRKAALNQHLIGLQKADGSWENDSDRMRENDPLIATSLAIAAVSA